MEKQISLKKSKRPILQFQFYQKQTIDTFIITTMDCFLYIIEIKKDKEIKKDFQLSSPGTAIYYDNHMCIVGGSKGHITSIDMKTQQKYQYSGELIESERPEIVCVYERKGLILAWNLNSQVFTINMASQQVKKEIKFNYEITSSLVISNKILDNNCACIAFNNGYFPFVFDCDSKSDIIETYKRLQKIYKNDGLENVEEEIYLMVYQNKQVRYEDCVIVLGTVVTNDHTQNYNILVCRLEKVQNLYTLEIQTRFSSTLQPIFASIKDHLILLKTQNKLNFINLNQNRSSTILNKEPEVQWIFIFDHMKFDGKEKGVIKIVFSKGFNTIDSQNAIKISKRLHICKLEVPL